MPGVKCIVNSGRLRVQKSNIGFHVCFWKREGLDEIEIHDVQERESQRLERDEKN